MIGDIFQPTHLLFVLVVALLVLGPKRLPEVGRALGRGIRDFKNALSTDELREHMISPEDLMGSTTPSEPVPAMSEPRSPLETVTAPAPTVAYPPTEAPTTPVSDPSSAPAAPAGATSAPDRS